MSGNFAYTTVPGKLPSLLSKMREVGVPQKASVDWLRDIGYRSSNDRGMLTVLKFIGFVDSTNTPSQRWREYRGAGSKQVLATGIREGYTELFAVYPDAHARDDDQLSHFFSARTDAGKQVVDKTVATFKTLVDNADFTLLEGVNEHMEADISLEDVERKADASSQMLARSSTTSHSNGLVININVQLTLPESTNGEVYRQFFAAMRESLLDGESHGD